MSIAAFSESFHLAAQHTCITLSKEAVGTVWKRLLHIEMFLGFSFLIGNICFLEKCFKFAHLHDWSWTHWSSELAHLRTAPACRGRLPPCRRRPRTGTSWRPGCCPPWCRNIASCHTRHVIRYFVNPLHLFTGDSLCNTSTDSSQNFWDTGVLIKFWVRDTSLPEYTSV